MDLSRGCILIARSLDKSDIFQNEKWLKVWIWCLIQANHKERNVPVIIGRAKTVIKVERGQFIYGRDKAAELLNMPPSTVRNIMEKLELFGNLDSKVDSGCTIITIRDYDLYQDLDNYQGQQKGQPKDSRRTEPYMKSMKSIKEKYVEDSNEFRLALYLLNHIRKNKPDYKEPDLQSWSKDADLLLRKDNRDIEEVKRLIKWVQNDDFEKVNVLSMSKLRKRYDQLVLKMNRLNQGQINDDGSEKARLKLERTQRLLEENGK